MRQNLIQLRFKRKTFLYFMLVLAALVTMSARSAGVAQADTIVSGLVDGSDTSSITGNTKPYGKPNQSRIWYNSSQNRWDALVPKLDEPDTDISASDHYIMMDVPGDQMFTAVELEDRNDARPDIFWDDAKGKLYVLGSHDDPNKSEFWRLLYDETFDSYNNFEVGDLGKGVTVPGINHPNANSPASLYVSPNENVWVAVMKDGGLQVQHSADGGATWLASPITLDNSVMLGVTTWIHFEHQGETFVGVFAGENGESGMDSLFHFWYIDQVVDPSDASNWINDSPNIPPPFGIEQSDDHVSAAR